MINFLVIFWLFKFRDSEALAKKIQHLLDHPESVTKAKEKTPNPRTFENVADEYENVYKEVLSFEKDIIE